MTPEPPTTLAAPPPHEPADAPGSSSTPRARPAKTIVRNGKRIAADAGLVEPAPTAPAPKRAKRSYDWTHGTSGARAVVQVGDCREVLRTVDAVRDSKIDLVFADPPFNWARGYDRWDDDLDHHEYLSFTFDWLDVCVRALRPGGALWVNIPDDWAAEIVCYLKGMLTDPVTQVPRRPPTPLHMENWCVWHYRFGQNTTERFINSKVHALYFVKHGGLRTWNPGAVLEMSDRAAVYGDARTLSKKDGMPPGRRVPMDVWYGPYFGRVQGNNKERRHYHDNQLPEAYLERVVAACSPERGWVMDPFLGSGTTGVMAHAMGRNFIGSEFSPENAHNAVARMRAGPVRPIGSLQGASTAISKVRRRLKGGPGSDGAPP